MSYRKMEEGMVKDLSKTMSYSDYLDLDTLLSAQKPLSKPEHHDELLFIIIHQTMELWMKLVIHELIAAQAHIDADNLEPAFKIMSRVKHIQTQMIDQWRVLATMTPSEYTEFRDFLGRSSGFQSVQYRKIEFLLGNKDAAMVGYHKHDPVATEELTALLNGWSIYDSFLHYLARKGLPVPAEVLNRDFTVHHQSHPGVIEVLKTIYEDPETWWDAYNLAEKLVDIEESFSMWRFRHLKTVQRIIGFKTGTGGSSGVPFLRKMVDHSFFPELWQVRTHL